MLVVSSGCFITFSLALLKANRYSERHTITSAIADRAMFREINVSKQDKYGPKRRWYQSDYFDLYIFYIRHSERMDKHADREFVGMQLCYDIRRNQRTLEWKKELGFSHHAVKKGGDTLDDHGASAALLQKGGVFDAEKVIDRFMKDLPGLPAQVGTFVMKTLAEYAKLNPPAPPTAEEIAAAEAAARVAQDIVAQIEAEAEALQAEAAAAAAPKPQRTLRVTPPPVPPAVTVKKIADFTLDDLPAKS